MTVRAVLRDAAGVIRRDPLFFAILVALAAAPGLLGLAFLAERDREVTTVFQSLFNLYLQLFATFRALDLRGAMPADYARTDATEGRYASAFLASLLSTIAILAGLALLVVPGLLLLALWGMWMPALAAERLRPIAALRRSWRLSRRRLGAMLALVLLVAALFAAAAVLSVLPIVLRGDGGQALGEVLIEPLLAAALIASPVIWACAYARLRVATLADTSAM